MKSPLKIVLWLAVAALGAVAYAVLAFQRHEPVSSGYILTAALCTYAIGYRFYSKWVAARVLALNDRRATPCEVHEDGRDYVKTNKWIVFGHHFAAISGPGPLVGPVLAAQFGYLPGTLWILLGVVLGGAVQDFVILFASMRRDGSSLGQMVKEELNPAAGVIGTIAILSIMVILLAVLALVVVNALAESPWGVFTVAATIPIAMFMGGYLRSLRPGRVLEASLIGVLLLLAAVWGGQFVNEHATLRTVFKLDAPTLAWSVVIYAFFASVLPVWLLLAPRDYLSTFMKLGTIFALAAGVLLVLPQLKMPALTQFIDGSGPVVPGKLFPFCFITIACGAISGFHTLISSGTTPKIITRERYARPVGYGAMCLESLVAIMAMIAACTLDPGVYLAMNSNKPAGLPADAVPAAMVAKVSSFGPDYAVTTGQMAQLAREVHEETLYGRTGGAATLAVGMANLFHRAVPGLGDRWLAIWYHFALMFEALFILTTLDAGTRVGRYLLQDALGQIWKPFGDVRNLGANIAVSGLVVSLWGYFLIKAVHDPDGGIRALWPIFGIANQLLASIALCLATTVILKMALHEATNSGATRPRTHEGVGSGSAMPTRSPALALVTFLPLVWLLAVTGTAAVQKIWHSDPRIGFLAKAREIEGRLPAQEEALRAASVAAAAKIFDSPESRQLDQVLKATRALRAQRANQYLDAIVTGFFLALVIGIVLISAREWLLLFFRKKLAELRETKPVWLPAGASEVTTTAGDLGLVALTLLLAKELSGEAAVERVQQHTSLCPDQPATRLLIDLPDVRRSVERDRRTQAYLAAVERRYRGVNRCC